MMKKAELPEREKLLINEEHSFEFHMTGNKNQNPQKKTSLLLNYFMFTNLYVIAPTATPTKEL